MSATSWVKSSWSGGNGGACVEVRRHQDIVEVRDTKDSGDGPILRFGRTSWQVFVSGTKRDGFVRLGSE